MEVEIVGSGIVRCVGMTIGFEGGGGGHYVIDLMRKG